MALLVVQFTHPGGEPIPTKKERSSVIKEWNYGPHKRKFMKAMGHIALPSGGISPLQELLFWGEWEPTSYIHSIATQPTATHPMWLHEPFLTFDEKGNVFLPSPISSGKSASTNCGSTCMQTMLVGIPPQNTDPFVFAPSFIYSLCRQDRFTSLKKLDAGSIILFGSPISAKKGGSPYFALDTVFVVGESKVYTTPCAKELQGFVPPHYEEIMGFSRWKTPHSFVCYKGATILSPVNGMYSFVPCMPCEKDISVGFPRVKLTNSVLPGIINDKLTSSPKYTESNLAKNKQIWKTVRDLVKKAGLSEGLCFEYQQII